MVLDVARHLAQLRKSVAACGTDHLMGESSDLTPVRAALGGAERCHAPRQVADEGGDQRSDDGVVGQAGLQEPIRVNQDFFFTTRSMTSIKNSGATGLLT
jgi:hypothetical protein